MLTVRKVGSIIEKLKKMLEEYSKKTEPEYYPPVEKSAGSDLRALHGKQPSREKHSCRKSRKGKRKGTGRVDAWLGWYG